MAATATAFKRYALYITPAGETWAEFAKTWLEASLADMPRLSLPLPEITATPRRYGLHGTIVPPFHLSDLRGGVAELSSRAATFCAVRSPVTTGGLALSQLGRFLALTLQDDSPALHDLANKALELCDPFRAPLTQADLDRHRANGLSPTQDALLRRWGYPYVRESFRFHITLTSKLPKRELPAIRELLDARLAPLLPEPWVVDHLSLMGEDADGCFHVIERFPLGGFA